MVNGTVMARPDCRACQERTAVQGDYRRDHGAGISAPEQDILRSRIFYNVESFIKQNLL